MSWKRSRSGDSSVSGPTTGSTAPASASSAQRSARAMSRLTSLDRVCTCMPISAAPSARTSAAAAIGSTVASVTSRSAGFASVSGAVADGTNSRSAISSHSPARPSSGRATGTSTGPLELPWHALYRLPEPQGQGWRGLRPSVVVLLLHGGSLGHGAGRYRTGRAYSGSRGASRRATSSARLTGDGVTRRPVLGAVHTSDNTALTNPQATTRSTGIASSSASCSTRAGTSAVSACPGRRVGVVQQ